MPAAVSSTHGALAALPRSLTRPPPRSSPRARRSLARRSSPGARSMDCRWVCMEAVTQREIGSLGQTLEPRSNYLVGRARAGDERRQRERRRDAHRRESPERRVLRRLAAPTTHTRAGSTSGASFTITTIASPGYSAKSQVAGTPQAIALTQANSTHYYQKPDDGERTTPRAPRWAATPSGCVREDQRALPVPGSVHPLLAGLRGERSRLPHGGRASSGRAHGSGSTLSSRRACTGSSS